MKNESFLNSPRFAQLTPGEKQALEDYYRERFYRHLEQLESGKRDVIFDDAPLKEKPDEQQVPAREPRNFAIPEDLYTFLCEKGRAGQSALKVMIWFHRHQINNTVTVTKSILQQETKMAFETVVKALEMLKQLKVIRQVSPTHFIINDASKWKFEQEAH